jgi:AraC-like DNA-binding protein
LHAQAFAASVTPKQFSRLIQLRNAVDDMAYPQNGAAMLTRLAYTHNFYDQAHFINTFRDIVKTLPSKFDQTAYVLAYKR